MARYALVIGISQNVTPLKSLSKTEGDAKAIAALLRKYGDFQNVEELTGRVMQTDLNDALTKFLELADRNEAVLYYTGHAIAVEKGLNQREAYFAPSDCRVTMTGKRVTGQQNGIAFDALSKAATECNLANLIVLLDCCHSEFLLQEALVKESFSGFGKKDYALISACRDREQAYAMRNDEHSLFTGALLDGLDEERAEADGRVKIGGLSDFIATHLKGKGQELVFLGYGRSLWLVDYRDPGAQAAIAVNETCPYQGLEKFTEATAEYYCGRDRLVSELLKKLSESAFVPVIGASGSGKSSLVRAGLLPIARQCWEILGPITPSDHNNEPTKALEELVVARYKRPGDKQQVRDLLKSNRFDEAVAGLPGEKSFLLVVDQFEELFTLVADEERRRFIRWLAGPDSDDEYREFQNKRQESDRLRIVMTMRADFMDQFMNYCQLGVLAPEDKVCWVLPMTQEELRAAIAEPAQKNGYTLESGLMDLIVGDVDAEPNSLPLLEYALKLLWEQRDPAQHRLTIDAYRTLGGDGTAGRLKGALNVKAEDVFNGLQSEDERTWVQRIFRRLVRTLSGSKDTRQRQQRSDLEGLARTQADRDAIANVLFDFQDVRLLVPDGLYVDLAHEALIEGWQRFADWRKEDRDVLRLVDRINDAYNGWQAANDDDKPKFLLPEGVVAQVETATAIGDYLSNQQEEFVQQSLYIYKPWLDPAFVIETIAIPGGKFKMGSPEGQGYSTEKPEHDVSVAAFHLGKYPVTQAQWRAVALSPKVKRDLNPAPSYARGDRLPVEQVSWFDAIEFCARLSRLKGETYRLPSEAEWEYACRAGQPTAYCFGDDANQLGDYGWYGNNSGDRPLDVDRLWQDTNQNVNQYGARLNANGNRTHPVGEKKPNAWGLYDMHGNVWEWCEDEWHDTYEGAPDDGRAWTSGSDSELRLLRGGSWDYDADYCRSANRHRYGAVNRNDNLGFRIVRVVGGSS